MNLDCKRIHKPPSIFDITSYPQNKPIFRIIQVESCVDKKRANPFIVERDPLIPASRKEKYLNQMPSNNSEGQPKPIFNTKQTQIPILNNTQITKKASWLNLII
jgi:hypothetical protein